MVAWAQNDDMLSTPLTLEAIEAGEITFKNVADGPVSYRVNSGDALTIDSKTTGIIAINAGDKVAFYGDNLQYASSDISSSRISVSSYCYVYGNVMSLISSTDFVNAKTLTGRIVFCQLFISNARLRNHPTKTLELPATTLADACYQSMFTVCTSLTTAPVLPATTLANYCYQSMFRYCSSLSAITCLATDISATICTNDWLYGVAASGTFTKAANMTGWGSCGTSKIPCGWTIQDAT